MTEHVVLPRVFALLYGDHPELHQRLVASLERSVPEEAQVWLWLNEVCRSTRDRLLPAKLKPGWRTFVSSVNVKKYPAMRAMFGEARRDDGWNFAVWFDDDSHIAAPDWWARWQAYVSKKMGDPGEGPLYIGQPWFLHYTPGQWRAVMQARWFKGRPAEVIKGRPAVTFATGGYWWLSRSSLEALDWPDPRLNHNGGDHLLAQAVRQQGWKFQKYDYGVKVNDGKRRGFREPALGDG